MRTLRPWLWLAGLAFPATLAAHPVPDATGALVGVSVEVEGRTAPLYPAPDGSGRLYLEAETGGRYAVRLANRTGGRLGVLLAVDGLNAISGERDSGADRWRAARPGRMYVLDPWDATVVRGWRTSLEEIRQFTFVDERSSYAARSGQASGKLGWIEVSVYREREQPRPVRRDWPWIRGERGRAQDDEAAPSAPAAKAAPEASAQSQESFPGTGWGDAARDPVVVVRFEPQAAPSQGTTLRYEYAGALRALGILPTHRHDRDRLAERERGVDGFAKPPRW
jgi:hypothetical protein